MYFLTFNGLFFIFANLLFSSLENLAAHSIYWSPRFWTILDNIEEERSGKAIIEINKDVL